MRLRDIIPWEVAQPPLTNHEVSMTVSSQAEIDISLFTRYEVTCKLRNIYRSHIIGL